MNKEDDYTYFMERSKAYAKVYDAQTQFMRGKNTDGTFNKDFDPTYSSYGISDFY
ncbi:MAG: glycoside hydrolase family 92 protein [Bacteroidales bacterium]|nr:glycoside hydrolase family 92 protein [Bacteroidales bacterium]